MLKPPHHCHYPPDYSALGSQPSSKSPGFTSSTRTKQGFLLATHCGAFPKLSGQTAWKVHLSPHRLEKENCTLGTSSSEAVVFIVTIITSCLGAWLRDPTGRVCLGFVLKTKKTAKLPPAINKSSCCATSSPTLGVSVLDFHHCNRRAVVSCCFDL